MGDGRHGPGPLPQGLARQIRHAVLGGHILDHGPGGGDRAARRDAGDDVGLQGAVLSPVRGIEADKALPSPGAIGPLQEVQLAADSGQLAGPGRFGVLLPHQGYYKRLSVLELQAALSRPRRKQLWKMIVRRKLEGQGACLRFFGKTKIAEKLEALALQVNSNDSDNKEAEGARMYFPALFGDGFTRGEENDINGALNYAYAIVRSLIARHLSARGFECAYGIFHKNQFNAFNLADDMIEPFRPIVDCFVASKMQGSLDASRKRELFRIVNLDVDSGGQAHSLSNAVERMAESLLAFYRGERDDVVMPRLIGTAEHLYE